MTLRKSYPDLLAETMASIKPDALAVETYGDEFRLEDRIREELRRVDQAHRDELLGGLRELQRQRREESKLAARIRREFAKKKAQV